MCSSLQDEHPAVPETAVIGIPHDIKGEGKDTRKEGRKGRDEKA